MKTEIIEAHYAEESDDTTAVRCALCEAQDPKATCCGFGLVCLDCAGRTFSVGPARNPSNGSWEMFWVIVEEGEKPQYQDHEWLKTRLRGADGKLGWKRYCHWTKIRDDLIRRLELREK